MKSTRRPLQSDLGFSIVEMIAVVAIIAILIGLLVPALSQVQKMAANVSQKAQFSSISMGLEAFREQSMSNDYPDSWPGVSNGYQGAQRLAEAMIGMDGFGFHPSSVFRSDGMDISGIPLYKPAIDSFFTPVEVAANIASRKGPYLELDTANAVKISSLDSNIFGAFSGVDSFILADKFKTIKNQLTGQKTGMPILYFKANTINIDHPSVVGPGEVMDPVFYDPLIYSFFDNRMMLMQNPDNTMDGSAAGATLFYEKTVNPNFTDPPRPRNNESFILLSAGADGLYGTVDDVYNFDTDK